MWEKGKNKKKKKPKSNLILNIGNKGKKSKDKSQKNEAEGEHCVRKEIIKFTEAMSWKYNRKEDIIKLKNMFQWFK